MIVVEIEYGTGNSRKKPYPEGTTVGQILRDNRAALGFGENVEAHIGSVPQAESLQAFEGMGTLMVHNKANVKQA